MMRPSILVCAAWLASAGALGAQNGGAPLDHGCASGSRVFQDVCQKTSDLYRMLAPQLGALVVGGNATLGRGTPLGPGRWTLGLRVHVLGAAIPELGDIPVDTGGARQSTFTVRTLPLPLPMVDGAVGLLPTLHVGDVDIGGLDALVNLAFLPNVASGGVSLRLPNGSLRVGLGARLGLVDPGGLLPALSVAWIRRDLPIADAAAGFGANTDHVAVENLRVRTSAWRLVASGMLGPVHLDAGVGRSRIESAMNLYVSLQPPRCTYGPDACSGRPFEPFRQSLSRTRLFTDASVNLGKATLTLEVGRAGAVDVPTFNAFAGTDPGAARWEGALGIRVGTAR